METWIVKFYLVYEYFPLLSDALTAVIWNCFQWTHFQGQIALFLLSHLSWWIFCGTHCKIVSLDSVLDFLHSWPDENLEWSPKNIHRFNFVNATVANITPKVVKINFVIWNLPTKAKKKNRKRRGRGGGYYGLNSTVSHKCRGGFTTNQKS